MSVPFNPFSFGVVGESSNHNITKKTRIVNSRINNQFYGNFKKNFVVGVKLDNNINISDQPSLKINDKNRNIRSASSGNLNRGRSIPVPRDQIIYPPNNSNNSKPLHHSYNNFFQKSPTLPSNLQIKPNNTTGFFRNPSSVDLQKQLDVINEIEITPQKKITKSIKVIKRVEEKPIKSVKSGKKSEKKSVKNKERKEIETKPVKILSANKFKMGKDNYIIEDVEIELKNDKNKKKDTFRSENLNKATNNKLSNSESLYPKTERNGYKGEEIRSQDTIIEKKSKKKMKRRKSKSKNEKAKYSVKFEYQNPLEKEKEKKKEGIKKFLSSNTSYSARQRRGDIEDYMEVIDEEIENIHKKIDSIMHNLMLKKITMNIEGENNENKDNKDNGVIGGGKGNNNTNNTNNNNNTGDNANLNNLNIENNQNEGLKIGESIRGELKGLIEAKAKLSNIRKIFHPPTITRVVRRSFQPPIIPGGPPIPFTQIWDQFNPPMHTTIESSYVTNTPAYSREIIKPINKDSISVNNFLVQSKEKEIMNSYTHENSPIDIINSNPEYLDKLQRGSYQPEAKSTFSKERTVRKSDPSKMSLVHPDLGHPKKRRKKKIRPESVPIKKNKKKPKIKGKDKKKRDNFKRRSTISIMFGDLKNEKKSHFLSNPSLKEESLLANKKKIKPNRAASQFIRKMKWKGFKTKEERDLEECTFQPKINKKNKYKTDLSFEERQKRWFKGKEYHHRKMEKLAFKKMLESCTFKPKVLKKEESDKK